MKKNIATMHGDGIGPEIVDASIEVLNAVAEKYGHEFVYTEAHIGGDAIDIYGDPYPEESKNICLNSDAVLLGAVGGPKWDTIDPAKRPEKGLLRLRESLGLYTNLRPAYIVPDLAAASPLKAEIVEKGVDFIIARELIGGLYFGKHTTETIDGEDVATDILSYSEHEIRRIAIAAFDAAMKRRKKVTCVDKANVLDSSKLWRKVVKEVAADYPEVEVNFLYVDNASMQIVKNPSQFDVLLTENLFGDILSDEASQVTGSIGMIPSASLGDTKNGLYEPIHGSAPSHAGEDSANPVGTILSAAMMLRYSFDMEEEAKAIEEEVNNVIHAGYRTYDIMDEGTTLVTCSEMGRRVAEAIKNR